MGLIAGPALTNGRRLARSLSVALFGAGLAFSAARVIGQRFEPVFLVPVGMAVFTAWVLSRLSIGFRILGYAAVFVGSAFVVAAVIDGSSADVWHGLIDGPRQVLTTTWPSPPWATICVALAAFVFVIVSVAGDLAMRARWRALAVVPLVAGMAALLAISAPAGPQWLLLLCAATATFALLWIGLDDRVVSLRTGSIVAAVVGLAVVVATFGVAIADRANPRFVESANDELVLLDPLADIDAQLGEDPARSPYIVESADLGRLPRWRTTTLDRYDGESWSAEGRLAPVGNVVNAGSGAEPITVTVTANEGTTLWPVPGSLLRTSQSVETDAAGRAVRILGGSRPAVATFVVEPLPNFDPAKAGSMPIIQPTDIELSFQPRATTLAGTGTVAERVAGMADGLRRLYTLDTAVAGGVQEGLINRFLTDGNTGNEAQFVTAFVLMARSMGVDARVAVGYQLTGVNGSTAELSTTQATTWPEVHVANGWTAVEIRPEQRGTRPPGGTTEDRQQTPAAPPPEIGAETEQPADSASVETPRVVVVSDTWKTVRVWALRIGLTAVLLLWPVFTFAGIVTWKKRRRRRGLKSSDPARRVTTAWTLATDALVDAGAQLEASDTNAELVDAGARTQPSAGPPLGRLQRHADAVTFTTVACDEDRAVDAVEQLQAIEANIAGSSSRLWRWRWTLSTRSLRRRTQSPLRSPVRSRRS